MKVVVRFMALDGTEFQTSEECRSYEQMSLEVDELLYQLPSRSGYEESFGFTSGEGYIQHEPGPFLTFRMALLTLGARCDKSKNSYFQDAMTSEKVHPSYPGYMFSEACGIYSRILSNAWYRVSCTDLQYREWGQPFFRDNAPEHRKEICLNCDGG